MTLECGGEVLCCGGTWGVVCNTEDDGGCVSRVGGWSHSYPECLHSGGDSHREVKGAEGGSAINRCKT
ncbi:hypothetical protein E2C01_044525 [Portunus trituberculatus]|uniref:Uncharacterized protein n=1 Tax=Portunus trituberculatus TaxID=210409 RepID=A0A5B7FYN2_PORTR|nr:hypothetical protein [Portunus trituberculatus]